MSASISAATDPRLQQAITWLNTLKSRFGLEIDSLQAASSDASFRRYFRVHRAGETAVLMDAPPPHLLDRRGRGGLDADPHHFAGQIGAARRLQDAVPLLRRVERVRRGQRDPARPPG